jgi:hypothetical protein
VFGIAGGERDASLSEVRVLTAENGQYECLDQALAFAYDYPNQGN